MKLKIVSKDDIDGVSLDEASRSNKIMMVIMSQKIKTKAIMVDGLVSWFVGCSMTCQSLFAYAMLKSVYQL